MGYWGAGLQGARQPKGAIYTVWDSNWREELEYQTLDHTAVDMSDTEALDRIEMQLKKAQRMGIDNSYRPQGPPSANTGLNNLLACADTIPELAEKLGLTGTDRENFIASVARYNELAHKGRDEDFAKDPRQLQGSPGPQQKQQCSGQLHCGNDLDQPIPVSPVPPPQREHPGREQHGEQDQKQQQNVSHRLPPLPVPRNRVP